METAEHIAALRDEGGLLAEAAERTRPGVPVPSCPGWHLRDLVRHTGFVHRWATGYVVEQHPDWVDGPSEPEILKSAGPANDGDLPAWFREGHTRLVSALEQADPGLECWTFLRAPSPRAFWARRQAHETTIHRVDAQLAAGVPPGGLDPFAPGLAADGIDELIMGFGHRKSKRGLRSDPPCWLALHATDSGDDWIVRMGTDSAEVARGRPEPAPDRPEATPAGGPLRLDGAGCELSGPAAALYLFLWNRGGREGLDLTGDPRVLDTWPEKLRVTW